MFCFTIAQPGNKNIANFIKSNFLLYFVEMYFFEMVCFWLYEQLLCDYFGTFCCSVTKAFMFFSNKIFWKYGFAKDNKELLDPSYRGAYASSISEFVINFRLYLTLNCTCFVLFHVGIFLEAVCTLTRYVMIKITIRKFSILPIFVVLVRLND